MVDNNNNMQINMMSMIINEDHHDHDHNHHHRHDHEHLLPIANVGRLMKKILPANAKVSKEAKETMQECATEFISFITGEASDRCRRELRKTVNGSDICGALQALGFEDYSGPLRHYLNRYRDGEESRTHHGNPPARDAGENSTVAGMADE